VITREIEERDLPAIQSLLKNEVSLASLKLGLKESIINLVVQEEKIEGFVMIRNIGGFNEITHWQLKPEHGIILKSMRRRLKGTIVTHEKESCKEKIVILEQNGFQRLKTTQGIFPNENAITFKQD
jgi:hypothetical protein